eukprot:SAG25_NODE_471_length_7659_cov_3.676720_10_plen_76_part_00
MAVLLALLLVLGGLAGVLVLIVVEIEQLVNDLDQYTDQISRLNHGADKLLDTFGVNITQVQMSQSACVVPSVTGT